MPSVRRQQEESTLKASVFIGTSLDGFIARANGDLDFLPPGGGEPHGYDEFMATVDALVIGRKTFETVLTFDTWPYGEKPVFVLSTRTLAPAPLGAVAERVPCCRLTRRCTRAQKAHRVVAGVGRAGVHHLVLNHD